MEILGLEDDGEMLVPEVSGLPEGLSPGEALTLLQRLRDHWITPPMREAPRRKMLYDAQVCVGLRNIWDLTRQKTDQVQISEWTVFNEGPGGYAISSKSRVDTPLQAGSVVAFRYAEGMAWSVCIVRWIRNDNPDKVELGLQLVAQSCTAVQIGFRGSNTNIPRPALALPPLAPTRRNRAIIAPSGSYVSRRFALLYEGPKLYVAQCRVLGLEMQTSLIELFQYEVDPYPI